MQKVVYSPHPQVKNPILLFRAMFSDLIKGRDLGWQLFLRDLRSQYRQSLLGYFWVFLPPIGLTITFVYLNREGLMQVQETPVPYAAFVMVGTLLWQAFVDALNAPLRILNSNKVMLVKINFPREALMLTCFYSIVFNMLIRLVLLLPVFLYYRLDFNWDVMLFPLGFMGLISVGFALGILLVPPGLLYQDVGRGIAMTISFWMYLTPVLYPPSSEGLAAQVARFNPVSPVLVTARDWLLCQPPSLLTEFYTVSGASLLLLLFAWAIYRISLPHLIARMGM